MKHLAYIGNLIKFAFRENPALYLSVALSLFSVFIEILAMSVLLPLFSLFSEKSSEVNGDSVRLLEFFGVPFNQVALIWVFLGLLLCRVITQLVGQTLSIYLGKKVQAQLGSRAFQQIVHEISMADITKESIGYYISLAGDEAFRASTIIISLTQFIGILALSVLYYIAIWRFSSNVGVAILLFMMLMGIVLWNAMKVSHKLGQIQTDQTRYAGSIFLDALNNIKAVRSFVAEDYVEKLYRTSLFRYVKTLFLIEELTLSLKLIPIIFLILIFSAWLFYTGTHIESVGFAFIVNMILYLMRFFPSAGQTLSLLMKLSSDAKAGKDVTEILIAPTKNQNQPSRELATIKDISISNASFGYGADKSELTLRNINLNFKAGNSYAIAGRSGLGKSTLIDLMLKFYKPDSGSIYVNNMPISEMPDNDLRRKVILINQEPAIFDDTIFNNIAIGMHATLIDVREAASKCQIDDFINAQSDGYDTRLHYQGRNLSGGQRQRIAIARALLRRPDVLILDESTSALDKETQIRIISTLLKDFSEKIIIFVTHDPDVLKQVDVVVDLELLSKS